MMKKIFTICILALLAFVSGTLKAQDLEIKVLSWNVLSFEQTDNSGTNNGFDVSGYVDLIRESGAEIVCLNEFETGTGRMGKEKMAELATSLGMYGFYIMSYPKDSGFYGNVILSRYPIVASASMLLPYKHAKGEGNYQWNSGSFLNDYGADQRSVGYADIMVPVENGGAKTIRVVCSHFDHLGAEKVRTNQASESAEFAGLSNPQYPTLMLGDLNTSSTSTLSPIYNYGEQVHLNWVDHIISFPKGKWTKVDARTIDSGKLSDHNAVLATLRVPVGE